MEDKKIESDSFPEKMVIARDPRFEVTWMAEDVENPRTWPFWYKSFIVAAMSFSTTVVYVCYPKAQINGY